jgi:hypothetical protein
MRWRGSLVLVAAACVEPGVGLSAEPVSCGDGTGWADVRGAVRDDTGAPGRFSASGEQTAAHVSTGVGESGSIEFLFIYDSELRLQVQLCGLLDDPCLPSVGSFAPPTSSSISSAGGARRFTPTTSEQLVIDASPTTTPGDCFAGRFHLEFGTQGELDGTFATSGP